MLKKTANNLFWWIFGIHAAVIGGLLIAPLFHRRPKEIVTFVEFVSEPAASEVQPVEVERPTEPEPIKKTPIPKPEPEKPKWEPAKVIRQDRRVTKEPAKPTQTTQPKPDLSKIKKALSGTVSPFAAYYTTVRERMYGAWQVPVGVAYGLSAQASITLGSDGSISNRRLIRPSGNTAFDQSVQSALNTVNRLPRPPADLPSRTITIEFAPQ